ncbi:hypothetical protein GALMADRAFT_1320944 [Galerina marginata CBS 339.88]|uniref:Uncharacterized protein n=1 Tax=Galerina marginata (strain CBS 339.88) TaxID=685588 RepID=A0A067S3B8_GALM3|nr:hypothetical protein GALMADRAFT_1320944 [Galerina marginata CBS 339.88]
MGYKSSLINSLKKPELVVLIQRQPEVQWPFKLGRFAPPVVPNVDVLRRVLRGNYGYHPEEEDNPAQLNLDTFSSEEIGTDDLAPHVPLTDGQQLPATLNLIVPTTSNNTLVDSSSLVDGDQTGAMDDIETVDLGYVDASLSPLTSLSSRSSPEYCALSGNNSANNALLVDGDQAGAIDDTENASGVSVHGNYGDASLTSLSSRSSPEHRAFSGSPQLSMYGTDLENHSSTNNSSLVDGDQAGAIDDTENASGVSVHGYNYGDASLTSLSSRSSPEHRAFSSSPPLSMLVAESEHSVFRTPSPIPGCSDALPEEVFMSEAELLAFDLALLDGFVSRSPLWSQKIKAFSNSKGRTGKKIRASAGVQISLWAIAIDFENMVKAKTDWEGRTGAISVAPIQTYLKRGPSWWSRARPAVVMARELGESSPTPNAEVCKFLKRTATVEQIQIFTKRFIKKKESSFVVRSVPLD